jgi:DNA-binding transcriptional LysR family regulator
MERTLDLDALRGLYAGVTLGSFAKAAERLGRSTSALSAQMQKLEHQAGVPLLRRAGRNLVPTPSGEILLSYARRLLDLNDEALSAVRSGDADGEVSLGVQEDFDILLTPLLASFSRSHPKVRLNVRVARNRDLLERVDAGVLDLALTWSGDPSSAGETLMLLPMCWILPRSPQPLRPECINLVAFEPPCLFRDAAVSALETAGLGWRSSFVSASLGGLLAAVAAGLGASVRTRLALPPSLIAVAGGSENWPPLPPVALKLHRTSKSNAAGHLEFALRETIADQL